MSRISVLIEGMAGEFSRQLYALLVLWRYGWRDTQFQGFANAGVGNIQTVSTPLLVYMGYVC